ncbi:MAG: molecular chaperone DnaJ [Cyanobacteria bacterium]|nr:molecular chaperone DnaJ [Cyanobacteriota bacterium]
MPKTLRDHRSPLVSLRPGGSDPSDAANPNPPAGAQGEAAARRNGFGAGSSKGSPKAGKAGAKGRKKKGSGLSAADRGPLGKHPDLEAIVARQRLHLPLSGRLGEAEVTRAWKLAAGEHHPDRGGLHDTMQLINGARDLLLGRGLV